MGKLHNPTLAWFWAGRGCWAACLLTVAACLAGCAGYQLGPVAELDYRTVAVPVFHNQTVTPQIETYLANEIIKGLQQDGTLDVVAREVADVVVEGEIIRYHRTVLRTERTDTGVPREYRMTVAARVSIRDLRDGHLIVPPTELTGDIDAFIGSDLQAADSQSIPLAAADLAQKVVTLLTERWDPQ